MIFILEDNDLRIEQFNSAISTIRPLTSAVIWSDTSEMMHDLVDQLQLASLISLDHDLVPLGGSSKDPGTGYEVVQFLAELIPCCPVIIHTSNVDRGNWMVGEFSRTNWIYRRVYPFGDDWIEKDWLPVAKHLLGAQ